MFGHTVDNKNAAEAFSCLTSGCPPLIQIPRGNSWRCCKIVTQIRTQRLIGPRNSGRWGQKDLETSIFIIFWGTCLFRQDVGEAVFLRKMTIVLLEIEHFRWGYHTFTYFWPWLELPSCWVTRFAGDHWTSAGRHERCRLTASWWVQEIATQLHVSNNEYF